MKKSLKLILCLALVMSTLLCFAACGGDDKADLAKYAGTYDTIISMSDGTGNTFTGELLDLGLAENGMTKYDITLDLKADGTGSFVMGSNEADIKWTTSGFYNVEKPENKANLSFSGSNVTIGVNGVSFTLSK